MIQQALTLKRSLILLGAILLLLAVKAKFLLYETLQYQGIDLFFQLQASTSVWKGHPLLFNFVYGPEFAVHNFLLLILLGPIALVAGSKGLFIATAILVFCALVETAHFVSRYAPGRLDLFLFAVASFFGPCALWLWDDSSYGWHVELLYWPCVVACGVTACARSWRTYLWAAMTMLIREDGAILAWSALTVGAIWTTDDEGRRRRLLVVTILCGVIFVAGMILQAQIYPSSVGKLEKIRDLPLLLMDNSEAAQQASVMALEYAALLLPLVIFLRFARWSSKGGWSLVVLLIASASQYLSAVYYPIDLWRIYGIHWPPRFGAMWGLLTVIVLLALTLCPRKEAVSERATPFLVFMISILSQMVLLISLRGYDFSLMGRALVLGQATSILAPDEERLLTCLGKMLPRNARVQTELPLLRFFERQDFMTFLNSFGDADLKVKLGSMQYLDGTERDLSLGRITLHYRDTAEMEVVLQSCSDVTGHR